MASCTEEVAYKEVITIDPAISIIVPVYNVEKYIYRCVDSILGQTCQDFELILVDDGSPDNCGAICDEYAAKDARIRVIHKLNSGASSARNAGLDVATGKYIMFCDSDDYASPDWAAQMYEAICLYPNAFINCNAVTIDKKVKTLRYDAGCKENILVLDSYFDLYNTSLDSSLWNKIYSREAILKNNFRFNEQLRIGEDVAFNSAYYKLCDQIVFVNSPLYFYCSNDSSLTRAYTSQNFEMHRKIFSVRIPLIEEVHIGSYLDSWLYRFTGMLDEIHDPRNTMSFLQKIRYNQKMMQTEEFVYCVSRAPGKHESPLFMRIIRKHNYYLYWLFQQLCKLKARFHR